MNDARAQVRKDTHISNDTNVYTQGDTIIYPKGDTVPTLGVLNKFVAAARTAARDGNNIIDSGQQVVTIVNNLGKEPPDNVHPPLAPIGGTKDPNTVTIYASTTDGTRLNPIDILSKHIYTFNRNSLAQMIASIDIVGNGSLPKSLFVRSIPRPMYGQTLYYEVRVQPDGSLVTLTG